MRQNRGWAAMGVALFALGCSSRVHRPDHPDHLDRSDAAASDEPDSGTPTNPEEARSGERLRARWLVEQDADDGRGVFAGWHDDELDMDCRFTRAADGTYRCVPVAWSGLRVYPDGTCAEGTGVLALLVTPDVTPLPDCTPRYASYLHEATQCDESSVGGFLRITGPSTANRATQRFVMSVFGACNAWNPPEAAPIPPECRPEDGCDPGGFDPGTEWVFCEYETASASSFVKAEAEVRDLGHVRQVFLHGDDGSLEPSALLHPELDVPLVRDWWTGNGLVPQHAPWDVSLRAFVDEACSIPALCFASEPRAEPGGSASGPPACMQAVIVEQDACSAKIYALGERLMSPSFCGEGASQNESSLVCFGPTRDIAPIPYQERAVGTWRLRPMWIAHGDRLITPTGYFEDHELGTACVANQSGGVVRCEPAFAAVVVGPEQAGGWRQYFADAACEQSLGFAYVPKCGEPPPSTGRLFPELVRMRSIGASETPAMYTGLSAAPGFVLDCVRATEPPAELFEAEPIEPSDLVMLAEVAR